MDPAGCAVSITTLIDDVANIAAGTMAAVTDCKPRNFDQLTCASDITDLIDKWVGLTSDTVDATGTCGQVKVPGCVSDVLAAVIGSLDTSVGLMAAASDCLSDAFSCTVDVMDSVDTCNDIVDGVAGAVDSCKLVVPTKAPPSPAPKWSKFFGHHRRLEGENTTALPDAIYSMVQELKPKAIAKASARRKLMWSDESAADAKRRFRARIDMFTKWVDELGMTGKGEDSTRLVAAVRRAREVLPRLQDGVFEGKGSRTMSDPTKEVLV